MSDNLPDVVVIADDDPRIQDMLEKTLRLLPMNLQFRHASTVESILHILQMQEVDLVTLDINFTAPGSRSREGLDALPTLVQIRPRVPVIVVSADLDIDRTMEAMRDHPQVRGVIDKGRGSFTARLHTLAQEAIQWGHEQRRKADALFDRAEAIGADGNPHEAASLYLEAYKTGDLASTKRLLFKDRLLPYLPLLEEYPTLLADAYRTMVDYSFAYADGVGMIYYAQLLKSRFPEFEREAEQLSLIALELENKVYAIVTERLRLIDRYREEGNFEAVLNECRQIQQKLGGVLSSHEFEAEAFQKLGRVHEAIAKYLELADMALLNGELGRTKLALQAATRLDLDDAYGKKIQEKYENIERISREIRELSKNNHFPYLRICGTRSCQEDAIASESFFDVDTSLQDGECDICGVGYRESQAVLRGKTIVIIGGRFGRKYQEAIEKLGAKEVLHHNAFDELPRIPGLISKADGVLIVTGSASHSGTNMAEAELAKYPKPKSRIHFYGVRQVVRGLVLDLLPRMKP